MFGPDFQTVVAGLQHYRSEHGYLFVKAPKRWTSGADGSARGASTNGEAGSSLFGAAAL